MSSYLNTISQNCGQPAHESRRADCVVSHPAAVAAHDWTGDEAADQQGYTHHWCCKHNYDIKDKVPSKVLEKPTYIAEETTKDHQLFL